MKEYFSFMLPFFIFGIILAVVIGLIKRNEKENQIEKRISASLFKPHGGNLKIETLAYEIAGSDTTTIKKTLENVSFAQLKLYPTIGCTKPTLFYLLNNSQKIEQIVVDNAKIID